MNKATKGTAYFCNKPQCRTAQNRLKKLIYSKGYDRTEALKVVLDELTAQEGKETETAHAESS